MITYYDKPIYTSDYVVRFSGDSERSKQLQQALNEGVRKLRASGQYDKYFERFELEYYRIQEDPAASAGNN